MTRLLILGDVHLSDRAPSSRTETYCQDILDKVRWCCDYAGQERLDGILALGDVFHVKAASRTSHWLVQETAEAFHRFPGETWIVPGNHDLSQDRLDSLSSQPLGSLALAPRIHLLDGYLEAWGIYGIPYLDSFDEFADRLARRPAGTRAIATHASIFPPGDHPPYDHIPAEEIAERLEPGMAVLYGHIHSPHGAYRVGGVWFSNFGAISRGSLHEETLRRIPRVAIWDSTRSIDSSPAAAQAFPEVASSGKAVGTRMGTDSSVSSIEIAEPIGSASR